MSAALSVVVVNWNSREDLRGCLESLRAQGAELEIIVVDNGSSDGSVELVRRHFSEVTILAEAENLGFGAGTNRGIATAHGEWVCTLNNDATVRPGWAEAIMKAARAAPGDCGMLQSLMLYRDRAHIVNSTGIEICKNGWGRDRDVGRPRPLRGEASEIFCPCAGAAAYRRSMLEAVRLRSGYFDPGYFLYYEDLDLGWRCQLAGWTAAYVPEAVVTHVSQGSARRHPKRWLEQLAELNRVRTLIKNASPGFMARATPQAVIRALRRLRRFHDVVPARARQPMSDAIASAWRARAEVEAIRKVERRAVERRWVQA